jgi:hypothetical protein
MPDITLRSNAPVAIRGFLPPALGNAAPLALNSSAVAMVVADTSRVTLVDDEVSVLDNLVPNGPDFIQTVTAERPNWATDADLGRETMQFVSSTKSNLLLNRDGGFNSAQAHTFFAIAKKTQGTGDADEVILGFFDGGSERSALLYRSTASNSVQHWYGSASGSVTPQQSYVDEEWNLIIGSYDGSSEVSVSINGAAPTTLSATIDLVANTEIYLGQPGLDGGDTLAPEASIDAAGVFTLDCFGSADEEVALLADIKAFCTARMGELITLA